VVVICGVDDDYPENVPVIARTVKDKNPKAIVVLAGKPADETLQKQFEEAGVDYFIHIRSDVLHTLEEIFARMEVSK